MKSRPIEDRRYYVGPAPAKLVFQISYADRVGTQPREKALTRGIKKRKKQG